MHVIQRGQFYGVCFCHQFLLRWKGWLPEQVVDNLVASSYVQKARISGM